jgi:hypothetical protein
VNNGIHADERRAQVIGCDIRADPACLVELDRRVALRDTDDLLNAACSHSAARTEVPRLPVAPVTATRMLLTPYTKEASPRTAEVVAGLVGDMAAG